jgi:pimeloyl-ACP methyl ester carboxylesterase
MPHDIAWNLLRRPSESAVLRFATGLILAASLCAGGCQAPKQTPVVIFLDGASHFTAGTSVRQGLRLAGYEGDFQNFVWTSFLGWGADHLVVARSKGKAKSLARRIARIRERVPDGEIHIMGLSAGTAVVLNALEQLPAGVDVDSVVLFSSSVSADRDLSPALRHVRGKLYATSSKGDLILRSVVITADGRRAPPAGRTGFRIPRSLPYAERAVYEKVVNLHWKPAYVAFGWNGGHVSATTSKFVRCIIAPRILSRHSFPLDRPLIQSAEPRDAALNHAPQERDSHGLFKRSPQAADT